MKDGPPKNAVGVDKATEAALQRWAEDGWSQAPYQFERKNLVQDMHGKVGDFWPCEEEALMGYPRDYTCAMPDYKSAPPREFALRRHTLLGNAWSLFVTTFIAQALILPSVQACKMNGDSAMYAVDPSSFDRGRASCPYNLDLAARMENVPETLSEAVF